jgi:hypothetical protein
MITFIGETFPDYWYLGPFEKQYIKSIIEQVDKKFPHDNNIILNTTWFWVNDTNEHWIKAKEIVEQANGGNLFLLSFVDPAPNPPDLKQILKLFKDYSIYKIGNFDGKYSWHFLSTIWGDRFKKYDTDELVLHDLKYKFLSYSRKPHDHRVKLYKKYINNNLLNCGIATLGSGSNHNLTSTLNENYEEYVEHGHWYGDDPKENYGVPHDIFSLGKPDIWQGHFLNIVNESMPNDIWNNHPKQELMVTEKTLKPIIGLRPFLINGDSGSYKWLRDRGFKTFTHWFPVDGIENSNTLHNKIIEVLIWLKNQNNDQILQIYQDMLPDLIHNRNRFFEFAQQETLRIKDIFEK